VVLTAVTMILVVDLVAVILPVVMEVVLVEGEEEMFVEEEVAL